jgi:hypothetical protein
MMAALTLAASLLTAADVSDALTPQDAQCRVIHYAADGTRRETPPSRAYTRPSGVSTSSKSSNGGGHARASSSVSASSSSSSGGKSVAKSDDGRRSITRTYDDAGCTVVIDERPTRGE